MSDDDLPEILPDYGDEIPEVDDAEDPAAGVEHDHETDLDGQGDE